MSKTDNAEDSFLGRWSRRKQQSKIEDDDVTEPPQSTEVLLSDQGVEFQESDLLEQPADEGSAVDEEILTDEDMVPIETLNADSDYSPFFSEGVSKQLRNMALKRLFFSGKFAFRDGLDDYDDDFTNFEPLGNTVTSDMKFHQRRKEKARLAKLEEERLEQEKQLAAAENAEQPEDSEATDQPSVEEASGDSLEGTEEGIEGELLDPLDEIVEGSTARENPLSEQHLLEDARILALKSNPALEHPDHRSKQVKPSVDDSIKPDRENT